MPPSKKKSEKELMEKFRKNSGLNSVTRKRETVNLWILTKFS